MVPNAMAEALLIRAAEMAGRARRPESTYRLQLHAGFTFEDARAITPYLRDLGITHAYASPYLKARPGSTHGYDIVDHGCLNPEIGTDDAFEAWCAALREAGMGQILDTVPNHMGVGTNENAWWNDVLENGPASRYGAYFDIAWRSSPRPELQDKILLSVLGEPYGDVLEAGQLKLTFADGAFAIAYYDRRFPVAPRSYTNILSHRLDELERSLGPEDPALLEYQSILTGIRNLPEHNDTEPERMVERQREKEVVKRRLSTLASENEVVSRFIAENVEAFNGQQGDSRSFDLLDALLERQCYRLAYWRVAPDEINYRRFFDINDLAALSMEREDVFEAAHRLVLRLVAEGKVDGLRIDHPDGLYDPAQYFRRLQEHHAIALARHAFDEDPGDGATEWSELEPVVREQIARILDRPGGPVGRPLYVVAEKILGADEELVDSWPVDGTSGYDFLNQVNGLFVDPDAAREFTRRYNDHVQDDVRFSDLVYRKKALIMLVSLSSELHMLTNQLDRLAQKTRRSRDFTFNTLRQALGAVIAAFPVYRSYIADDGVHEPDRRYIEIAVRRATARNPLLSRRVFRFIRGMLLLESPDSFTDEDRAEQRRFAGKFQQVTAPVTAKGVEDTAFYIYNRLISINEVGGEPGRFGTRPEAIHDYNQTRQTRWPRALSPLSTHDTKRSEDVRARINVLSEIADDWWAAVERWSRINEPLRGTKSDDDQPIPDANEEYLLYQTLIGAWPLHEGGPDDHAAFVKRIQDYMLKALHEAKVHSSWINPNAEYDEAVVDFIGRILDPSANSPFLNDFRAFQQRISAYGLYNSLAQTLLKLASPGVPDTYQGTELWDFSLVDPDNRRPVDYELRARMLADLRSSIDASGGDLRGLASELLATKEDGRIKLYATHRALVCRREHPGLFAEGEYFPLSADGPSAAHLFAFARRLEKTAAVVAVPRLIAGLVPDPDRPPTGAGAWAETRLVLQEGLDPSIRWQNLFTGEILVADPSDGRPSIAAAVLFAHFPIALLIAEPSN